MPPGPEAASSTRFHGSKRSPRPTRFVARQHGGRTAARRSALRAPARTCDALPNLAVFDQGGAWRAAGPASAPGSALGGTPAARRATPQGTQIKMAHSSRRPAPCIPVFLADRLSSSQAPRLCRLTGVSLRGRFYRDLYRPPSPNSAPTRKRARPGNGISLTQRGAHVHQHVAVHVHRGDVPGCIDRCGHRARKANRGRQPGELLHRLA